MDNLEKKFSPIGNPTWYDPANNPAALNIKNLFSTQEGFNSFMSPEVFGPDIINQQRQTLLAEKQRLEQLELNKNYNSLRLLARQAFPFAGSEDRSDQLALSYLNQINGAQSPEELNQIRIKLEELEDKATSHRAAVRPAQEDDPFYVSAYGFVQETATQIGRGIKNALYTTAQDIFTGTNDEVKSQQNLSKKLEELTEDQISDIVSYNDPTELFGIADNAIRQKHAKFDTEALVQSIPNFEATLDKALKNPNRPDAFNNFLNVQFDLKRNRRGDMFYRDDEEGKAYIGKKGKESILNPEWDEDKFFKYDLEKETLQTIQGKLLKEISAIDELDNSELTPEITALRNKNVERLNGLKGRLDSLDQIHGINAKDRTGAYRALLAPIASISNLFRNDFRDITYKNALYQPEVLEYDALGRPVTSIDFAYTKADGTAGYNFSSILESGANMVGIILPSLGAGKLIQLGVGGLAASKYARLASTGKSLQSGYKSLNSVGGMKLADRLSTLGTVTTTTMPMMLEEEKAWGGDYLKRAFSKALVEGLTEAIGFPDIGALKAQPFVVNLRTASKRAAQLNLTFGDRLALGLSAAPQFAKTLFKQNAIEAFEEEMSLFGNALIEHSMFDQSMFTEGQRERTKISESSMIDTFVDSFIGGLIYSGGTTGRIGYQTLKRDNVRDLSNWQAANNPELFKARLQKSLNNGDISQEQFIKGLARINELSSVLSDDTMGFKNLRDLKTLMEDKDAQYKYFQNALSFRDLMMFNYDDLTDEDKEMLGKIKVSNYLSDQGIKQLNEIREKVAIYDERLNKEEELTKEEQLEYTALTIKYLRLKDQNKQVVNRGELDQKQLKIFQEMGIVADPTITFTKEDYEKELSRISQEILKTKKQINKYENLTDIQKKEIIEKLFQDKADTVKTINSPYLIKESMKAIKQDLDYLKTDAGANKHEIEQRELLYNEYGKRYYELTNRDEGNFNEVEKRFEQEGYYTKVKDPNQISTLLKDLEYLEENKDVVDKGLYDAIKSNLYNILGDQINNILNLNEQERIDVLTSFYESIADITPTTLYDVDRTNNLLSLNAKGKTLIKTNFTQAEVDKAREAYIQKRSAINAKNIANGKKPYEQPVTEDTTATEVITDVDDKTNLDPKVQESIVDDLQDVLAIIADPNNAVIDESGNSPIIDAVKNLYDKYKDEGLPALQYIANVLVRNTFQYSPKKGTPYNNLDTTNTNYFNGNYSFDETVDSLADLNKNNPKSIPYLLGYETLISLIHNDGLVKYSPTTESMGMKPTPTTTKTTTDTTDTEATEEDSQSTATNENPFEDDQKEDEEELDDDEFGDAADVVTDKDNKTEDTPKTVDTQTKQQDEKADLITEAKKEQLLQLASPLRTIAVELNEDDERYTDPVELRRVEHINEASSEDFSPTNTLVLMNRQKFMRMYLEAKYPDKSEEQIDADIKTINTFFETSEEGTPLSKEVIDLIGDNLFSNGERPKESGRKSEVYYWQSTKGKGFSKQPDVVVTYVDKKGKLLMFKDGYPLDLNTSGFNKKGPISWNVSKRILKQLNSVGISEEQVAKFHKAKADAMIKLKKQISEDNDRVVETTHSISEGVIITKSENYVRGTQLAENKNPELGKPTIDSFKLITNKEQNVFGKRNQFELGRLYYNVNGTPVKLSNRRIDKEEAEALADLLYGNSEEYPDEFETIDEFRTYLFNLINDVSKDNRLYFILNNKYDRNNPEDNPILVRRRNKDQKYVTLTRDEFLEVLPTFFYKASKENIKDNKTVPRYRKVDGEIKVTKQSQTDYLLSTHDFPTDGKGNVSVNVNKVINFQPKLSEKEIKTLQPKTVVKSTPATPATTPTTTPTAPNKPAPSPTKPTGEVTEDGFVILDKSRDQEVKQEPKVLGSFKLFFPNRAAAIESAKKVGLTKTIAMLEGLSDQEYVNLISSLSSGKLSRVEIYDPADSKKALLVFKDQLKRGLLAVLTVDGVKIILPLVNKSETDFSISFNYVDYGETQASAFKKEEKTVSNYRNVVTSYNPKSKNDIVSDKQSQQVDTKPTTPAKATTKQPATSTTNAIDDIERRRKGAKLLIDENKLSEVIAPSKEKVSNTLDGLKNLVSFLNETFSDKYGFASDNIFDGQTLRLTRNGVEFSIPFGGSVLGGGIYIFDFNINDIIDAKYDAELAALEKSATPTKTSQPTGRPSFADLKNKNSKVAKHMDAANQQQAEEITKQCKVTTNKLKNVGTPKKKINPF